MHGTVTIFKTGFFAGDTSDPEPDLKRRRVSAGSSKNSKDDCDDCSASKSEREEDSSSSDKTTRKPRCKSTSVILPDDVDAIGKSRHTSMPAAKALGGGVEALMASAVGTSFQSPVLAANEGRNLTHCLTDQKQRFCQKLFGYTFSSVAPYNKEANNPKVLID
jgi:hypothetical protein